MSSETNNNSVWTDTKGIAKHFKLKPATIRKKRSKQGKNQLTFQKELQLEHEPER